MNDNIDSLYAQFEQKILELRTGQALMVRSPWMKKIYFKWIKFSQTKKILLMASTAFGVSAGVLGAMSFYLDEISSYNSWTALGSFAFPILQVALLAGLYIVGSWDEGPDQQQIVDLLTKAIQTHPHLHDSVTKVFEHLEQPNIKISWWEDIFSLLNQIIHAQEPNLNQSKQSLATLLEKSDIYTVEIEHPALVSPDDMITASSRTKI